MFFLNATGFTDRALLVGTTYSYRVKGIDLNGTSSAYSSTVSVTTGSTPANPPPQASLVANGNTFSALASVTLTATASDDGSINQVEFFLGNTLIGSDGSGPYSFSWGGLASGNHVFRARAIDNLGAMANSNSVTVSVSPNADTMAPTVPLGLTATVLNSTQIALAWNAASDAGGGDL